MDALHSLQVALGMATEFGSYNQAGSPPSLIVNGLESYFCTSGNVQVSSGAASHTAIKTVKGTHPVPMFLHSKLTHVVRTTCLKFRT